MGKILDMRENGDGADGALRITSGNEDFEHGFPAFPKGKATQITKKPFTKHGKTSIIDGYITKRE